MYQSLMNPINIFFGKYGTERVTIFVQLSRNGVLNIHISDIHTFSLVLESSGQNLSLSVSMPTGLLVANHYYC